MTLETDDCCKTNPALEKVSVDTLQNRIRTLQARIKTLEDFCEFSPVGFLTLDPEGRLLEVNMTAMAILKVARSELIGRSFYVYLDRKDRDTLYLHLHKLFRYRKLQTCELRIQNANDRMIPVVLRSTFAMDQAGLRICRSAVIEIDDREHAGEVLQESEQKVSKAPHFSLMRSGRYNESSEQSRSSAPYFAMRTLHELTERILNLRVALEAGRLGTWDCDLVTGQVVWNRCLYDLLGRDPDGPAITGETFFRYIHPDDIQRVSRDYDETLRSGTDLLNEYRVICEDGQTRWLAVSGRVYRNPDGQPVRIAGVTYDITHRKQIEEGLQNARDELEGCMKECTAELEKQTAELARLTSELMLAEQRERQRIAQVLHDDLQQLMIGAKIGLEVLTSDIDASLRPAANRVLDLVSQSIKVSRSLTAELSPPVLASGDLSAALEWLARWMHENQGFEVELQIEPEILPRSEAFTGLLFQSVRELLLNVLKHAGVKSATVKIEKKNGELRVVVSDRGAGFDPETVLKEACSREKFGLVSIRDRLVNLGGDFQVESASDAGSSISLIVPLHRLKPRLC